jgi:hypothetical protein
MINSPYDPPQVIECRGPCGDSQCPHKPPKEKNKWWQEALIVIAVGIAIVIVMWGVSKIVEWEAIKKWGPIVNQK